MDPTGAVLRSELSSITRRILDENLRMQPGERGLFFTDSMSRVEEDHESPLACKRRFLHAFFESFVEAAVSTQLEGDKYESTGLDGAEPRENIWKMAFGARIYDALLQEDLIWPVKEEVEISSEQKKLISSLLRKHRSDIVDCVVAFPWYSTTHTRFRDLLTSAGARYVSMPQFTERVLMGPMQASPSELKRVTGAVHCALQGVARVVVTDPVGTCLSFSIEPDAPILLDDGDFSYPGAFGNLPAGEVYMSPADGTANGMLVLTSCPGHSNIEPVHLHVEEGFVTAVEAAPYAVHLEKLFKWDPAMRNIAEFGIGTNARARDISSEIEGEKVLGTCHIALGDDSTIGGHTEAREHIDYILRQPSVSIECLDGPSVRLLEAGKLCIQV